MASSRLGKRPLDLKGPFTPIQVADLFRLSPNTVKKWYTSGRLEGYRIPGSLHRRFTRANIEAFLNAHPNVPRPVELTEDAGAF